MELEEAKKRFCRTLRRTVLPYPSDELKEAEAEKLKEAKKLKENEPNPGVKHREGEAKIFGKIEAAASEDKNKKQKFETLVGGVATVVVIE